MPIFKQLIRQPIKTFLGIVLIMLLTAVMCMAVGQRSASTTNKKEIDKNYTTIALPTENIYIIEDVVDASGKKIGKRYVPDRLEERAGWMNKLIEERMDIIKGEYKHGFASAYIPALNPDNCTKYDCSDRGRPYSAAMLVVKVTSVGEPYYEERTPWGYVVDIEGTVEEVVALQEDYKDPTGRKIYLTVKAPTEEMLSEIGFWVGEEYLVYGRDYYDEDWGVRCNLSGIFGMFYFEFVDSIDMNRIKETTEEAINAAKAHGVEMKPYRYYSEDGTSGISLSQYDYDRIEAVSLTIQDTSIYPEMIIRYTDGKIESEIVFTDKRYITTENGEEIVSIEEYMELYGIPTIVKLEGTVEEFLASEEADIWRRALEETDIYNHSFPVLGVEDIMSVAEFARLNTRITTGRVFTQEEYDEAGRVCIISETLAGINDIRVGDEIEIQYFDIDYNMECNGNSRVDTNNVAAGFYSRAEGFDGEAESYTVVGLYRGDNEWQLSKYSFVPNTIFVPQKSVQAEMRYDDEGVFYTLVLNNGTVEEFDKLQTKAGFDDWFVMYDQGYSEIADSLSEYDKMSMTVLYISLFAWTGIFLLYLVLFTFRQKATVSRMFSLGAGRGHAIGFVLGSSAYIIIPGALLGVLVSYFTWEKVSTLITNLMKSEKALEIDTTVFGATAAVQIFVMFAVIAVAAALICRVQGMSKRR